MTESDWDKFYRERALKKYIDDPEFYAVVQSLMAAFRRDGHIVLAVRLAQEMRQDDLRELMAAAAQSADPSSAPEHPSGRDST